MHSLFCYVCLLSSLLWTSLSSNPTVGSSSHFYNSPCHFLPTLITVWQNIERSLKFILYFSTYYLCFLIIFWSIGSQCNQCDWEEDGLCWMDINAYDMVSRQMTGPVININKLRQTSMFCIQSNLKCFLCGAITTNFICYIKENVWALENNWCNCFWTFSSFLFHSLGNSLWSFRDDGVM